MNHLKPLAGLLLLTVLPLAACQSGKPQTPPTDNEKATSGGDETASGPEKADRADKPSRYRDPEGRFSTPIPPKWQVDQREDFASLVTPEETVYAHLVVVDQSDLQKAVEAAWSRASPQANYEPKKSVSPPTSGEVEELLVVNYGVDPAGQFAQAVARLHQGTAYVILFEGPLEDVQRRNSQLQVVSSGFEISAAKEADISQVEPTELTDAKLEKLTAFIERQREAFGLPGASVGVVQQGEVVFRKGFGTRDGEGKQPMTPETLMMIGSTTKTMTTMMAGSAVDDGKLSWDQPVVEMMPQFELENPEKTREITLENTFCACTGAPRRDLEVILNYDSLSAEQTVEQLADFKTFTDFGEAFQYSNQMVAAGGYATTIALGGSWGSLLPDYREALRVRVLEPIGMSATTTDFAKVAEVENRAVPHTRTLDGAYRSSGLQYEKFVIPLAPAGAAWSNTDDMTRYLQTLLAGGKAPGGRRVVSRENLERTWKPQIAISDDMDYGLGWIVSDFKGKRLLSHGGNTIGYTSELSFLPEDQVGLTLLVNGRLANSFTHAVRTRLLELVYERDFKAAENAEYARTQTDQGLKELKGQLAGMPSPERVEPLLGTYEHPTLGKVDVAMKGESLMLDVGEFAVELRPVTDEAAGDTKGKVYAMVQPPAMGLRVRFVETDDGGIEVSLGEGVMEYTFTRVSE